MKAEIISLVVMGFFAVAFVGLLVYVIINRLRQKEKENFPDRKT